MQATVLLRFSQATRVSFILKQSRESSELKRTQELSHFLRGEKSYQEALIASAKFNKELDRDRKSRIPFLESQTRVAQTLNATLNLEPYQRLKKTNGYVVAYPLRGWLKRTRYLNEGNDKSMVFQQTHQTYLQLKANANNPNLPSGTELNESFNSIESFRNHHQFYHNVQHHHPYHQYQHYPHPHYHHHHHPGYSNSATISNIHNHSMVKSSSMPSPALFSSHSMASNFQNMLTQYDLSLRYNNQSSFRATADISIKAEENNQRSNHYYNEDEQDDSDGSEYDDKKKKKKVNSPCNLFLNRNHKIL